ncbi:MAG: RNA polymerase sigma factor SigZ [Kofleriaceae bacterium]|nr:MAG: RNA polymerase sigma factor SigZ [Kofleriaceae bacterium]MBZ0231049.1 RNA polymerase sigma factor SigZ [Kofleriaceae bacterium]
MDVHPTDPAPDHAATLWNQFAAPLRSFVAKRAPREVEADDVLQDVFVRIQEQLPKLREADRIDAWIFQIARNVVADAFRRRTRREALDDRTAAEGAPSPPTDDDRAAETALAGCLAPMIAQLPEPYREAIELTEIRGMTQADAARLVGISISGMKSRVQRGREHLKGIIGEFCRVETDVRGGVIECDPLREDCGASVRPSPCSNDSMGMKESIEVNPTETTTNTTAETASTGCCGGPAPKDASACCALDAEVKATGGSGCGCGAKPAATTKKGCC